jgi:hypothetical protein
MYAAPPQKIRERIRRWSGRKRKGKTPVAVLREQAARRRLQAYQYGAYDTAESALRYETGAQFFGSLQEELDQQGQLSGSYDDDLAAGGLGLKIKLKLPKFIRKMKPLKVIGKAAKIAAPIVGVATGGILLPAAIGAGGSILQKGKRARLFKDVVGSAAVGAAGGVARRAAPSVFRFGKKLVGGVGREAKRVAGLLKSGAPSVLPSAPEIPDVDVSQVPTYTPPPSYTPTYQPTETAAAYTPPGEEVPGTTDMTVPGAEPPKADAKKLLVPALIAAALLL